MKSFSCFITGTDTGVGKTLVTCALLHAFSQKGLSIAGMKPIAAGISAPQEINEDTMAIMATSRIPLPASLVTPYPLKTPVSPNIAARMENTVIEWQRIRDSYDQVRLLAGSVIVEGVGGFKVPLSDNYDTADMAVQFGLPVILVVGLRLGCLNHALLTAEAILSRGLHLAGWIANHIDPMMPYDAENIASLEDRIPAPRLATIPYIKNTSVMEAAACLDLSRLGKL